MNSAANKEKFRDALINNKRASINSDNYRIETIKNTGIYYASKININYYYRVYRNGYYTGCSGFNLVALVNDIIDIYIS